MSYAPVKTKYFSGVDLHGKNCYVCVKDKNGTIKLHKEVPNDKTALYGMLKPYMKSLSLCCESTFNWYWLANFCRNNKVGFFLGHALYIKYISGSKQKNDRIDSRKLADLLRTGMLPLAYPYPEAMRTTRDLLRRRHFFVRQRAGLYSHIRTLLSQEGIPPLPVNFLQVFKNRPTILPLFSDNEHRSSAATDLKVISTLDATIKDLELQLGSQAKHHNRTWFDLLQTIPGAGVTMALTILYEVHDIGRFKTPQQFSSYCRVVKVQHASAGKAVGGDHDKIGNPYLKWAFHEIAMHAITRSAPIKRYYSNARARFGTGKALAILAHKFAVAVWMMLKHGTGFNERLFVGS